MAPGLIAVSRMKGEDGGGKAAAEDHKKDLLPAKKTWLKSNEIFLKKYFFIC